MQIFKSLIEYFYALENQRVYDLFGSKKHISVSGGNNVCAKAFVVSELIKKLDIEKALWIGSDYSSMEAAYQSLNLWCGIDVLEVNFRIDGDVKTERDRRIKVMDLVAKIRDGKNVFFVSTYEDLLIKSPDFRLIDEMSFEFRVGQKISMMEIFEKLITAGYLLSDEQILKKGSYFRSGDVLFVYPVNADFPMRIDIGFDEIEKIEFFDQLNESKKSLGKIKSFNFYPVNCKDGEKSLLSLFEKDFFVVEDEVEVNNFLFEDWNEEFDLLLDRCRVLSFVAFNDEEDGHVHLHYLSVSKYRGAYDLANDLKSKVRDGWRVILFTKEKKQIEEILKEYGLVYTNDLNRLRSNLSSLFVVELNKEDIFPQAFQNPELKIAIITEREFSVLREEKKKNFNQKVFLDFLTSLRPGDFVVHIDHGISIFSGLEKRTVDSVTREYLKLCYAENDKLFVPIDQADKVNKYIGSDDQPPKLTRLGSAEWLTITKKLKKETEEMAKELLNLYAERKSAKGFEFKKDDDLQVQFEQAFEYEETPGQAQASVEVKNDMEKKEPMDRLLCGDVGFGKTEVAMRAAFKAVRSGKQVAVVSPITILADQHYRSFKKRMEGFDVRVDTLSRFRTKFEQAQVIKKLKNGEIDVIVGTHRLLQKDIEFKNLGLAIIDEEQRFGVKQKEKLKEMKKEVDVLTLSATPIPRTLNFALNKLRDISTINTPPPGRLPVITEVRRFSLALIRETILRELNRGGQVYFLHNRVQTIDGMTEKLKSLVPEARFIVAHGKLSSSDLEERILAFKDHKFDVLVSSTIIENGIDLSNANTLIVNNADKFGLAQLYQLRGRVGRGRVQAYAYFLYHGQRLKTDAKKRLRAIVEASELGSGFQIAMKDLEIRGAGDLLGAKQHGVINVVGVSHFVRMLNKAVDDLKAGKVVSEEGNEEVQVELPISAYIPDSYILNAKDKIAVYQKLAAADSMEYLNEVKGDIIEDYGLLPIEVINLFKVIEMKILAKKAKVVAIKVENVYLTKEKQISLHISNLVGAANVMNLLAYNSNWGVSGNRLKISLSVLGFNWMEELRVCLEKLAEEYVP